MKGYEPDGDSVRFQADDLSLFKDVYRAHLLEPNRRDKAVQLRLEAIDAPETHYGIHAQKLGDKARGAFLKSLGFTNMQFNGNRVTTCTPNTVRAIILTKALDPHGRPISYLLVGDNTEVYPNGSDVIVDTGLLSKTINMSLLSDGIAYPLLYTSTPLMHREYVRLTAEKARSQNDEVWSQDESSLFELKNFSSIIVPDGVLIYPKLFRRSIDYLKASENGFVGDLPDWLRKKGEGTENDLVMIKESFEIHLSELLSQYNDDVSLKVGILDMTFIEK